MITKNGTVHNENGIHCRPATQIVKFSKGYGGSICIKNETGTEANAKSVLAILGLGLVMGDGFSITVIGDDEEATCNAVLSMLEQPFDYMKDND